MSYIPLTLTFFAVFSFHKMLVRKLPIAKNRTLNENGPVGPALVADIEASCPAVMAINESPREYI